MPTLSGKDCMGVNGEPCKSYSHMFSLTGVEPPYYVTMMDYHAVITLKSGRTIQSEYNDVNGHGSIGGLDDGVRSFMVGMVPTEPETWTGHFFEILNYFPGRHPKEDFSGASVKGSLTLEIRKAVLVKTAPFRPGVTVDFPRQRYQLDRAEYSDHTLRYDLIRTSVKSVLRGSPAFDWDEFSMLIYNPAMRSSNAGGGNGGDFRGGFFCEVNRFDGDSQLVIGDWRSKPMPAEWMDNAKISFFTTEPCGRITLPYEIKGVNLEH